jgi:hypothetical protein
MAMTSPEQINRTITHSWDCCVTYVRHMQDGERPPVGSERHQTRLLNAGLQWDFAKSSLRPIVAEAIDFFPSWDDARKYVFEKADSVDKFELSDAYQRSDPYQTTAKTMMSEVIHELFLEEGQKSRGRRFTDKALRFFWNP